MPSTRRSDPVRTVASLGLWVGWAVGMVASLRPHPLSLTALRLRGPGGGGRPPWPRPPPGSPSALAVVWALVTAAWAFAPGDRRHVGERPRLPQRAPLPRCGRRGRCSPVPCCWRGPWRWPARRRAAAAGRRAVGVGGLAAAVGLPLAWLLVRSMHNLSRRWAVFVPAGMVLHDPLALLDPVLFPRSTRRPARPRGADTDALDLTQRAPGLGLGDALREETSSPCWCPASGRATPSRPPVPLHPHPPGRGARRGPPPPPPRG